MDFHDAMVGGFGGIPDPDDVGPARENNPFGEDLRRAAEKWITANPDVYRLFIRFALEMSTKGRRFGVKLLAERVRWEVTFTYGLDYKVNNNYTAYIARMLVADHPSLTPFIQFRKTRY